MDRKLTQEMEERRAARLNLVRSADRSEKIRTYNYAQVSAGRNKRGHWYLDKLCRTALLITE